MPYIAVSSSPITVREVSGPVDPGFGVGEGHPSHPIAPGRPGHPSHPIYRPGGPVDPGYGVELPPVIEGGPPEHPDQGLPPTFPVRPGHGLPRPPHVWPRPPRPVKPDQGLPRPPLVPIGPDHPIYLPPAEGGGGGAPDQGLPLPPGAVWPPLPPDLEGKVMCFVWIVGVGYRWTVIDTSLKPSQPLPPTEVPPAEVDNTLPPPPAATPKA
jgi:hypothetical protein